LSTKIQLSFRVRQYAIADGCTYDVISARNGHAIPRKSKYVGVAAYGACGMIGGIRILAPVGLTNG